MSDLLTRNTMDATEVKIWSRHVLVSSWKLSKIKSTYEIEEDEKII